MTLGVSPIGGVPRLDDGAFVVAIGSIVCVPLLVAWFPRWAGRVAVPLLAVTSVGVYLTVPDVERVSLVMIIVVVAAVYCFARGIAPDPIVVAGIAFLIIGAAILDSGGRGGAIVRAAGCFGVLLAAPVAGWFNALTKDGAVERRPALSVLVLVHCLVVGWSSRAFIREKSVSGVVPAVAAALVIATVLLLVVSRPVAAEP